MNNAQKEAKKQSLVMLAYSEGEEIEFNNHTDGWCRAEYPDWDWSINSYRVKPRKSCNNCKYYGEPEWCSLPHDPMRICRNESEWVKK